MIEAPAVPRAHPTRTCVGCRTPAPQGDLLRIAVVGEGLVADPRRRAGGRGVYVHQRPDCLKAAGRGGLARALKRNVSRAQLDAIAGIAAAIPGLAPGVSVGAAPVANVASQGVTDAVERAPDLMSHPVPASPVDPADRASHGA